MTNDKLFAEMQKLMKSAPSLLAQYRRRLWKDSQAALKNLQHILPKKTPSPRPPD
jgi:hypothetical protein